MSFVSYFILFFFSSVPFITLDWTNLTVFCLDVKNVLFRVSIKWKYCDHNSNGLELTTIICGCLKCPLTPIELFGLVVTECSSNPSYLHLHFFLPFCVIVIYFIQLMVSLFIFSFLLNSLLEISIISPYHMLLEIISLYTNNKHYINSYLILDEFI